ncbi:hypothetical protein LguiA_027636 [Lonicera macranthoides]
MLENHMKKSISFVSGGMIFPPTFPSLEKCFQNLCLPKKKKGTNYFFSSTKIREPNETLRVKESYNI